MRTAWKMGLVLGVVAFVALPALAQPPGGGRGGRGAGAGVGALLLNKSVQDELKITDEQKDKLSEAVKKVRDAHQEDFTKLRGLEGDELRDKRAALTKTVSEETLKAVGDILKPEQVKRVKEIALQQRGAEALTDADVQKSLKLKDDQKDKLKTIVADYDKARRDAFQAGGGGDFQAAMEKMATLRKETNEKAVGVLSDDQKKQWKELTGAPFEVKFEGGGFGGGKGKKKGGGENKEKGKA